MQQDGSARAGARLASLWRDDRYHKAARMSPPACSKPFPAALCRRVAIHAEKTICDLAGLVRHIIGCPAQLFAFPERLSHILKAPTVNPGTRPPTFPTAKGMTTVYNTSGRIQTDRYA